MKKVKTIVYALIVLISCVMMFIPATASAQPAITSPTPSTTLSGSTVTFNWTAGGTSVNEWWLYVGTSAGGSDIDDSGSLGLNTSTTVSGLPTDGSTVHVRLWYRQGSSWPYVDFQYTASGTGGGGTLGMTSPVPGSTLSGSSETFTWTTGGTSVNEWWLYVGTSAGGSDIDDSGSLGLNTSTTVSGLPTDGSTVHVRLWYRQGSSWPYVDFQYTASGTGGGGTLGMTSPVSGSTLSGSSETFTWTAGGTSVDEWWLNVGTSAGGTDIDDSGSLGLNTSTTVSGLPTDGSTVHVRLWYRQGSSWPYVDFQYTASGTGGGGTIEMTSPVPGSTLSGSSVTFTWTAGGTSVDEWWLNVGSSVGGYDIDTGSLGINTSKTVSGLPTNGSTVYVRLEYRQGSSWESMDYQYTASGTGGGGTIRMLSPAPGSTLSWNTETFRWTAGGTHVSNWFLYLGSEQGSDDIYHNDSSGGNTTATVYDIPNDGRTIYVKLWYETGGWWRHINYQYTANADGGGGPLPSAYITSPAANSTLSCYQTFSWNDNGNPATDHWVDIGSYPYGRDLWESGSLGTSRSVTVSGLPAGITVYVRLSYYSKGSWHFTPNYAYTTPSGGC